jgi:hypothetical protein
MGNRELVSMSREIPASETALQAEATEPSHSPDLPISDRSELQVIIFGNLAVEQGRLL